MSETTYSGTAAVVRDRLQDLDELLLGLAWESMSDDELVAVALHVERHVRRVAAVQNAAVAHVASRGIAGERGSPVRRRCCRRCCTCRVGMPLPGCARPRNWVRAGR